MARKGWTLFYKQFLEYCKVNALQQKGRRKSRTKIMMKKRKDKK